MADYLVRWTCLKDGRRESGSKGVSSKSEARALLRKKQGELKRDGFRRVKVRYHKIDSDKRSEPRGHPKVSDFTGHKKHRTIGSQVRKNWLYRPDED